jgi:hypothetical protein
MALTIGKGLPSENRLATATIATPISIWIVPISADAVPAISP